MAERTEWSEGSVQFLWPALGESGKSGTSVTCSPLSVHRMGLAELQLTLARQNGRVSSRASSVYSASFSDKGSKAPASPSCPPQQGSSPTEPHATIIKSELPSDPQLLGHSHAIGQRPSSTAAVGDSDGEEKNFLPPSPFSSKLHGFGKMGHAASMEGASGVPDRIEEGVEPD